MNTLKKEIVTLINEYTKKASELYQESIQRAALTPKMDIFNTELSIFALYLSDINAFICLGNEERTKIMPDIIDQFICDENTEVLFNNRANMYHSLSQKNRINNIPHSWLYSKKDFPEDDLLLKLTVLLTDVISIDTLYGSFTTDENLKQLHMFDITFGTSMTIFFTGVKKITTEFFEKCHDLFQQSKQCDSVLIAYKTLKPGLVSSFIPNGVDQARLIVSSLSKIMNLDLECCTPQQCLELLNIYIDVSIRTRMTTSPVPTIVKNLLANHTELIKNEDLAILVVTYCQINVANPLYALDDDKSMLALNNFSAENKKSIKFYSSNTQLVNEDTSDEDYGYVKSKPIYTNGINGSNNYLANLRTTEGQKLNWKRLGSTSDKNVDGIIDVYSGTLSSGETYATLYLNMYSNVSSQKAPKGFIYCNAQSNSDIETNKSLKKNDTCNASGNMKKQKLYKRIGVGLILFQVLVVIADLAGDTPYILNIRTVTDLLSSVGYFAFVIAGIIFYRLAIVKPDKEPDQQSDCVYAEPAIPNLAEPEAISKKKPLMKSRKIEVTCPKCSKPFNAEVPFLASEYMLTCPYCGTKGELTRTLNFMKDDLTSKNAIPGVSIRDIDSEKSAHKKEYVANDQSDTKQTTALGNAMDQGSIGTTPVTAAYFKKTISIVIAAAVLAVIAAVVIAWNIGHNTADVVTPDGSKTVYITPTGDKYHRKNCNSIKKKKVAVPLTEAESNGYTPCSRCRP